MQVLTLVNRISPRSSTHTQPAPAAAPSTEPPREPELELTISPPSVEETLAARRARRQAILAKYAHMDNINTSQTASPSPGPSSAVEPTPFSSVSDAQSQPYSVPATPAAPPSALASKSSFNPEVRILIFVYRQESVRICISYPERLLAHKRER